MEGRASVGLLSQRSRGNVGIVVARVVSGTISLVVLSEAVSLLVTRRLRRVLSCRGDGWAGGDIGGVRGIAVLLWKVVALACSAASLVLVLTSGCSLIKLRRGLSLGFHT